MSLTKEQKKELERLSEKLRKIEKLSVAENIDLDVFMTDYNEEGIQLYGTEKISTEQALKRKQLLENKGLEKSKQTHKNPR